jgi:hypothetical protein
MNKDVVNPSALSFIIIVLASSFCIGTSTHIVNIFQLGFLGYTKLPGVSQWNNMFWTALTIADPLVVFLLFSRRRAGALAGFLVLAADIAVNYRYFTMHDSVPVWSNPAFSAQSACFLFSAVTLPFFLLEKGVVSNRYAKCLSAIPYLSLFTGLLIHGKGLHSLLTSTVTLWPLWVHCSMIVVDSALLVGFFMKLKAGFWAGILAFGAFAFLQLSFSLGNYFGLNVPFTFEMGMTVSLCCLSITALLNDRQKMTGCLKVIKNNTSCPSLPRK